MNGAKITLTLNPEQFDLLRETLEDSHVTARENATNRDLEHVVRNKERERSVRLGDLINHINS
jgi:hypothetical protein